MAEPTFRKRDFALALVFIVPVVGKVAHHLYNKRQAKQIQELDKKSKKGDA